MYLKEAQVAAPKPQAGGGKLEFAIGVLNGVLGDYLHRQGNGLATPMELFLHGRPVRLDRASLQSAYPAAAGRLVLWVHGFAVTEGIWAFSEDPAVTYGTLLQRDLGLTPLYLRYNTGLHISENGEALARLLETLVAEFPVPVEELVLVGYSMGGLVVRSACHVAAETGLSWLSQVRRAIYLAVPHLGSSLERMGKRVASTLQAIPNVYTQLVADVVNLRSNGVKDLGFGNLLKQDWEGADNAALLQNRRHPAPLLPGISHHLLVGTLAPDENHLIGRSSATESFPWRARRDGRARRTAAPTSHRRTSRSSQASITSSWPTTRASMSSIRAWCGARLP